MAKIGDGVDPVAALGAAQLLTRPASEFGNDPTVESLWAIKAVEHMEVYFNLISAVDAKILKLTPHDEDIYNTFREHFPNLDVKRLVESDIKSEESKKEWREFCMKFENVVEDFNFATLLRLDCEQDYAEENTTLVPRVQFYAVEIARNREGLNDADFCGQVHVADIPPVEAIGSLAKGRRKPSADYRVFVGKPSHVNLQPHLERLVRELLTASASWTIPLSSCQIMSPRYLEISLNRAAAYRSLFSFILGPQRASGQQLERSGGESVLIFVPHADESFTGIRTEMLAAYASRCYGDRDVGVKIYTSKPSQCAAAPCFWRCTYPALCRLEDIDFGLLCEESEWLLWHRLLLCWQLLREPMPQTLPGSVKVEVNAHTLLRALEALCTEFSAYYSKVRVLVHPEPHLNAMVFARIWLIKVVQRTVLCVLNRFGLNGLDRM
ncbi:hypothetical protein HPB51_025315 [Rhipicephalus microplus]|uniref:DALR anticodon binding domain-containing protein n=1 Tax=Rhipicephalus microplus TaxID=6941 RepID=A0A9J6F919_RHIMP|nr:hypothetical protein HPB51_025315 [Rhipicephalus microplus]